MPLLIKGKVQKILQTNLIALFISLNNKITQFIKPISHIMKTKKEKLPH